MGNGTSTGQRSDTPYGKRDVRIDSADNSNWPELAGAKLAESGEQAEKPYNNNNHDDIYSAVIIAEPLREFTRFAR